MSNHLRKRIGLLILALNLLLASCSSGQLSSIGRSASQWSYADLRLLDPADPVPLGQDLVAFYAHISNDDVSIRLDFLDLDAVPDADIYLALDTVLGGSEALPLDVKSDFPWDYLLVVPATGPIQAIRVDGEPVAGLELRISRDPTLDMVTISFRASPMELNPGTAKAEVMTTPVMSSLQVDQLGPVRLDGLPPLPVPVLIAFWNVFPASTPAEALRSWDGAHAGPESSRHGLKYLLEGVKASRVPVALFDLKSPLSLSILDYMSVLNEIKELDRSGLLIAPEVLTAVGLGTSPAGQDEWVTRQNLDFEQKITDRLKLRISPWTYWSSLDGAKDGLWPGCLVFGSFLCGGSLCCFVGVNGYTQLMRTEPTEEQATRTGLAIPFRRYLISAALSQPYAPVLLGGDFSRSAWGNQLTASVTLRYVAAHPWIRPVDELSLSEVQTSRNASDSMEIPQNNLDFVPGSPAGMPIPSGLTTTQINDRLLQRFLQTPHGRAYDAAWQAYSLVTASTVDQLRLKAIYLGQIGHLLAAADWENNPRTIYSCQEDIDWDGQPECVLASQEVFSTFESEGGLMTSAFVRLPDGIHQVIAPSYQFTVGLSDPTLWRLERGIAADPGTLGGAFQDLVNPWKDYLPSPVEGSVEFVSMDMSMRKKITLLPSGFRLDLTSNSPWTLSIPLALDPWNRFTPGWGDKEWIKLQPLGLTTGIKGSILVEVETDQPGSVSSFLTSRPYLSLPEDPNQEYGAGHYLPFPMTVLQVSGNGTGTIKLTVSQPSD